MELVSRNVNKKILYELADIVAISREDMVYPDGHYYGRNQIESIVIPDLIAPCNSSKEKILHAAEYKNPQCEDCLGRDNIILILIYASKLVKQYGRFCSSPLSDSALCTLNSAGGPMEIEYRTRDITDAPCTASIESTLQTPQT